MAPHLVNTYVDPSHKYRCRSYRYDQYSGDHSISLQLFTYHHAHTNARARKQGKQRTNHSHTLKHTHTHHLAGFKPGHAVGICRASLLTSVYDYTLSDKPHTAYTQVAQKAIATHQKEQAQALSAANVCLCVRGRLLLMYMCVCPCVDVCC